MCAFVVAAVIEDVRTAVFLRQFDSESGQKTFLAEAGQQSAASSQQAAVTYHVNFFLYELQSKPARIGVDVSTASPEHRNLTRDCGPGLLILWNSRLF